ncbi:hypothetical protein [Microbacterium album]|uniref:Uncharacterized protein n=1 Tax=Microbacterium album TaxID=2053191 RepID=A0A917IB46_9MICO|nr:hypothetical protein [Microbacterium album]GGH34204.1 hypothetical protein GCM10010921_01730 [Microbacterium album]
MITHDQIGSDEDLAREVLIIGRDIAPCLDSFPDGSEQQKDAIAILRRVYKTAAARGSHLIKSQAIGPARVEYADIASAFDGQPRRALRALCGASSAAGLPVGSFPNERPIARLWPERYG